MSAAGERALREAINKHLTISTRPHSEIVGALNAFVAEAHENPNPGYWRSPYGAIVRFDDLQVIDFDEDAPSDAQLYYDGGGNPKVIMMTRTMYDELAAAFERWLTGR